MLRLLETADEGVELDGAGEPAVQASSACGVPAELACADESLDSGGLDWAVETRRMLALALPSVVIQANCFFIWLYNAGFAGTNLGVTEMAAVSLANLAGNLTALSIQYGLIYALETLSSHAVGSGRYEEVGVLAQRCLLCCALAALPGFAVWLVMEPLLLALGQPPAVSALAGRFLRLYLPGMPGAVCFEVLRRFLGCQDIVLPIVPISALVAWVGHPLLLRCLLAAGLGFDAVPTATWISMWLLALLSLAYVLVAKPHRPQSWQGLDPRRALCWRGMRPFLRLAVPGVFSMSEWWYWEVVCGAVGALGELPLAVHSIAYGVVPMLVMAPIGVSIALATRVGQLIGEGRPRHAKLVARATFGLGMGVVCSYVAAVSLAARPIASFFTTEEASPAVFAATLGLWPLVCTFLVFDGFFMLLSGVVRALSLQLQASACVLLSLWALGMPAVLLVAFRTDGGLRGVWTVLIASYAALDVLCGAVVLRTDWARVSAAVRASAGAEGGGAGEVCAHANADVGLGEEEGAARKERALDAVPPVPNLAMAVAEGWQRPPDGAGARPKPGARGGGEC